MGKAIELMVNRHKMRIPSNTIVYASVTDKLGNEDFLRVSRSSLVAYTAVEAVKEEVVLHGGIRIPYSRSRRKEIIDKIRNCMERQVVYRGENKPLCKPCACRNRRGIQKGTGGSRIWPGFWRRP